MGLKFNLACKLALALDGVSTKDHFGGIAFSAHGRTFMTAWRTTDTVNFMFDLPLQEKYLALDGDGFSRLDNAWGRQGATACHLQFVEESDFETALRDAWERSKTPRKRRAAPRS